MRRVLPLVCAAGVAAGVLAGSACVNLTPPHLGSGGGGGGGGGSGGTDGAVPPRDAAPDAPADGQPPDSSGAGEAGPEGPSPDAGRDAGADVPSTLADGLVGYWKLDEAASATTALDSSGRGNHGQIMGSPGRVTSGLPPVSFSDPRAFTFAGQSATDDAIEVPDDASLRPNTISIAVWVRFASLMASSVCGSASPQSQYIIERRNNRGSAGMFEAFALIKQADGTITFLMSTETGAQTFATSTTVLTTSDVGKWLHLVATYDGATMKLFVNGALERSTARTGAIAYDPLRPLYIGRTGECGGANEATWDARLNGTLDDIRIYDRALSANEALQLAAGAD